MHFMCQAIFLDRDGVIIENRPDYVRSWSDVSIFDQAIEAIYLLSKLPFKIIIITNQSAVGRGIISLSTANEINQRIIELIIQNHGRVDDVLVCPHQPEDHCSCRKPAPGLFFQAAQRNSIDLSSSVMIGDAVTDLQAAQAAGISTKYLVRTGRGIEQEKLLSNHAINSYSVVNNLLEAVHQIASKSSH